MSKHVRKGPHCTEFLCGHQAVPWNSSTPRPYQGWLYAQVLPGQALITPVAWKVNTYHLHFSPTPKSTRLKPSYSHVSPASDIKLAMTHPTHTPLLQWAPCPRPLCESIWRWLTGTGKALPGVLCPGFPMTGWPTHDLFSQSPNFHWPGKYLPSHIWRSSGVQQEKDQGLRRKTPPLHQPWPLSVCRYTSLTRLTGNFAVTAN